MLRSIVGGVRWLIDGVTGGLLTKTRELYEQNLPPKVALLDARIENLTMLTARAILEQRRLHPPQCFSDAEFRVFSQFGDDGLIQYLIERVELANQTFIEFGVEDYEESNTRFLMMNNNWSGLIMDGSEASIARARHSRNLWRHDVVAKQAFITAENVNVLIASEGFQGEIGLLHIDIDGNDYWVWKALEVVTPTIAIIEYNSVFGIDRPIVVPYQADFRRHRVHHTGLYAGASLLALCDLAESKGYAFVGSNSAGNNAYFVRRDRLGTATSVTPSAGYVESRFRESCDESMQFTFLRAGQRMAAIRGLPVYNTRTGQVESL